MKPETITLPLHQVGEPEVDFNDLWTQMGVPHERFDITIRRHAPSLPTSVQVLYNGRPI